jgi:SAM-dependent methyltransferase
MGRELAIPVETSPSPACNGCGAARATPLFVKQGYQLVRCRDCGLAYIANPPSAEEIAALYTAKAAYHEELLDPAHPMAQRMLAIARQHMAMLRRSEPAAGGRLLDIGCSSGLFLNEARAAGYSVWGSELSPETSAHAREHYRLEVHTGDWRDAGYPPGSFDVVTLFDVIEHLPDPLGELYAIRRLLKPGGLLLQSTPDIDGLFPRASGMVANWLDYWPHPEPPWHLYQFSATTLSDMTRKAGFRIARADRTAIGLDYSFGTPESWRASPKMVPYALAFAPVALLGKVIGMGDWLYLAARAPHEEALARTG